MEKGSDPVRLRLQRHRSRVRRLFIPEAMRNACSYELRLTTHHGYTAIPYRKGMAADGPRYKALGNSMAVPVMAWIGRRIAAVDVLHIQSERTAA